MTTQRMNRPVLVACPDARPPAYQAAIGLDHAGFLGEFVTGLYYDPAGRPARAARRFAPGLLARAERMLLRRYDSEIPADRVRALSSYDFALQIETRLGPGSRLKRALARHRTLAFDRRLASRVAADRPALVLAFSDVASSSTLPLCNRLGVPTIVSMVHGDVDEELAVVARERAISPEYMSIYLGDGGLDLEELEWLHDRRRADLALADVVLAPSEHIARALAAKGVSRERIEVIPYAADCRRFRPVSKPSVADRCRFLFAGGITGRKGIKSLLEAWRMVKRPGLSLELLGALPRDPGPLARDLVGVELLGRVAHGEMPARMAAADVFVFPSLFEGSAVVTYEALACGLPCIVTAEAGSVARDGIEGLVVPAGDPDSLAAAMARLGDDPALRARMAQAARARALEFDWPRYHQAVENVVSRLIEPVDPGCPRDPKPRMRTACAADRR